MKKLFVIILLSVSLKSNHIVAQITLEHTVDSTQYGYLFYPAKISDNETKYVFLDTAANTFSLYNLDFTPFLTNITVPHRLNNNYGTYFYSIMYITRSLFDCDTSNIEYLFASQSNPGNPLWVMRTDGTILFYDNDLFGPYCLGCPGGTTFLKPILTTEKGTKLVLMRTLPTATGSQNVYIYSLCGELPNGNEEYDFATQATSYIKIFPNPTSMQLNFEIIPPDNFNKYELMILNSNSQVLVRRDLSVWGTKFSIDVTNYSRGTYHYSLASKNKISQTGTFLISK